MDNSDELYTDADKRWLSRNIALVITFYERADKVRTKNRKISQRKIAQDLRWDTAIRDDNEHFKILNAGIALLAHTYNDYVGYEYFSVRTRIPFDED
jgi:hypothetical protein